MASSVVTVTIGPNPPSRLDKALTRDAPEAAELSRSRIARLIGDGKVTLQGHAMTDQKARPLEGQEYQIAIDKAVETDVVAQDIPLNICYEDEDLIVIDKPAGMVVHPAPGSPDATLVNALLHHFGGDLSGIGGEKRPGIVHRIDKDTSGLLVVAKSDKAHHRLAEQFERHTVERKYYAVVYGVPDQADPRLRGVRGVNFEAGNILKITTQLGRHKHDRQKQAVCFNGGRHAVTRARVVEAFGNPAGAALVECWLETGRTHQIRVHMAHAGHSLIGDPVYGGRRKLNAKSFTDRAIDAVSEFPRQALHAAVLGFEHPEDGRPLRFESRLPDDLNRLVETLRETEPV